MISLARSGSLAALALLVTAGCGPVPGGSLSGAVTPAPADWSSVVEDGHEFCEVDGTLYAQSHRWALASWWPVDSWAAIWIEEPEVRVRFGDQLFELRAVHATDPAERERVLRFRGYDPVPAGIALFRFEPQE